MSEGQGILGGQSALCGPILDRCCCLRFLLLLPLFLWNLALL